MTSAVGDGELRVVQGESRPRPGLLYPPTGRYMGIKSGDGSFDRCCLHGLLCVHRLDVGRGIGRTIGSLVSRQLDEG